jgi:GNAT superfamily N-acetyltransferase
MIHLSAQVEPFEAMRQEWLQWLPHHYEELALDKWSVPLDPDWQKYERMDAAGQLSIVTLRAQGRLAGYCFMVVDTELHYRTTLSAKMDVFWIAPEHRGKMGGMRLFKAVEAEVKRRGCKRMFAGSKLHRDSSRLFLALGYRPVEQWFSKMLEAP